MSRNIFRHAAAASCEGERDLAGNHRRRHSTTGATRMEFRRLGKSGLEVSLVGLGCNNFGGRLDEGQTASVVSAALDAGITLFDTSNTYGNRGRSEEYLGAALSGRRDQAIIATKFGMSMGEGPHTSGGSRKHIMDQVEGSLRRLDTDYIDLYQVHRFDPDTPIEETLRALDDVVRAGKVRYIGCSNFAGWQLANAQWVAKTGHLTPFVSLQNEWNMLKRDIESEVVPACREFGVGVLPFFPLASGLLTGKYHRGQDFPEGTRLAGMGDRARTAFATDRNLDRMEALRSYAQERGHSLLELAFSSLASFDVVSSVIAGATRPEQIEQNVEAVSWKLTAEDRADIDRILRDA
jgi:aryl-alcohol dehydrogenase-like predicted oxidoreductase